MELNIFVIYAMCKHTYLLKHTFFKKHSCWKSTHHVSWLRNCCDIVVRNGKKDSHNKVSYDYLRSPIQAYPNSWRSQYSHVFFILFSPFSWGKFEKTFVTSNVEKSGLSVFLFLTKEQKSFKKQKFCTLFFNMTWNIEMKCNTIFICNIYIYHMYNYDIQYNVEYFIN